MDLLDIFLGEFDPQGSGQSFDMFDCLYTHYGEDVGRLVEKVSQCLSDTRLANIRHVTE